MRAIRALVADPYMFQNGGIAIRIAMQDIDDTKGWATRTVAVLEQSDSGTFWNWRFITDEERYKVRDPATDRSLLSFPEGVGEAILEGLSRHYHGGPAPDRQQRADYDHERKRRDTLEDAYANLSFRVADIAQVAAGQRWPHLTELGTAASSRSELIFHGGVGCLGHMPYDYDAAHCPNAR